MTILITAFVRTLPLSQSFAVSNIGGKLCQDAREQLETRKETSGPLEDTLATIIDCKLTDQNITDMIFGCVYLNLFLLFMLFF